jgi:hypothetical protein
MAMDTVNDLIKAVLIDGQMTLPTKARYDGKTIIEQWTIATVLDASVNIVHNSGSFNGYVRFLYEDDNLYKGKDRANIVENRTVWDLWVQGWTSMECRRKIEAAQKAWEIRNTKRKRK